jgi:formate dehydrogenase major subunit
VRGDAVNELIGFVADPNVSIQESKALTGNIEAGRRSRGRRVVTSGPLVPGMEDGGERDLPAVGSKITGKHGITSARSQQDEET